MSSIVKTPHSHEPLKIFAFVGHSNTGKTRLIKHLVPELKRRGYSVAVIKHCAHGFSFDPEGKDSRLFMEAGSDGVAMISPDLLAVLQRKVAKMDSCIVAAEYFKGIDIILMEGNWGERGLKKIEVLQKGVAEKVECSLEELIAVVSDVKVAVDRPVFYPDNISKIADFLESNFEFRKPRVFLNIDGASIPLNAFVQKIFGEYRFGNGYIFEGNQGEYTTHNHIHNKEE